MEIKVDKLDVRRFTVPHYAEYSGNSLEATKALEEYFGIQILNIIDVDRPLDRAVTTITAEVLEPGTDLRPYAEAARDFMGLATELEDRGLRREDRPGSMSVTAAFFKLADRWRSLLGESNLILKK